MQKQDRQVDLDRFKGDAAYFRTHWEELLGQYPGCWVAIFNQKVVGADPDLELLLDQLEGEGIDIGRVFIEQATTKEELLILPSLLGRDVLSQFALFIEQRTDRVLLLEPNEADQLQLP